MKPLREIVPLKEIFDSHYPYEKYKDENISSLSSHYKFTSKNNNDYKVKIFPSGQKNEMGTSFGRESSNDDTNKTYMGINHDEGKDSHKIFGTVKHILQSHIKKNPHITNLMFSSSEPSRHKLYDHMAKSLGKEYEAHYDDDKVHRYYNVKVK